MISVLYCTKVGIVYIIRQYKNSINHSFTHSFIHSGHFYSAPSSPLLLRGDPNYSTDTESEFNAEAHRVTVGKRLAQGPYMVARAGVEPKTLRLKVIDSTNAPPRPDHVIVQYLLFI